MANKPMSDTQLKAVVKGLLQDSIDYTEELGDLRIATTKAYDGAEYGNEMPGRSQVVTREVRDAVEVAKPSLMRVFFGSHKVLEFAPEGPEDTQHAKEATAYAEHVIHNVNNGYMEFLSAIDDALIRKTGVFKAWWEESEMPVQTEHSGLTAADIQIIEQDDEVTDILVEETDEAFPATVPGPEEFDDQGQPMQAPDPEPLFDATVTRIKTSGRIRFSAVPPEEFVIHRKAKNVEEAMLVGHYREVTKSYLRELGYDEKDLENVGGSDEAENQEIEREIRSVGLTEEEGSDDGSEPDDSQTKVAYAELWVRVDYDGDGIAELRKICVAGSGYKVLVNDVADEAPIAVLCPSPVAHQAIGHALAELVEDIQKIKTMLLRNTLDSLANSIHPDVSAVEGEVNFDDLLNSEQGRILRQKRPGMIEYMNVPFIGHQVYPLMQYLDTLGEARTGMNEAAQGLNAEALQSTAKSAIDNATQAAMGRIEFIARTFIEGGVKRLFKLIQNLAHQNIDRPTMVRINNSFAEVDPRAWKSSMDLSIIAPLTSSSVDQQMQLLGLIAQKQEQIIQLAGPENPIAGIEEYRNTLAEIARLGGIANVDRHFKDPTNPASHPPPAPPQPDPQLILAQAEADRQRAEVDINIGKLELDVWKAVQEDDRKRDEMMAKIMVEAQKAIAEGAKIDMEAIRMEVDQNRDEQNNLLGLVKELQASRQQQAQQKAQDQAQGGSPQSGGSRQ